MGEGEDDDGDDNNVSALVTDNITDYSRVDGLRNLYASQADTSGLNRKMTMYNEVNEELYKPNALNEEVDQLAGISAEHYANISKSNS